ncbi:MAG: chromosome segregation protein SMC [Nitrospira sp.]|nr:chromosome segregation protein SMC [Nitrospira sp.]
MYLKSLEMVGFKSFVEGKIEFPEGVTAIVGPNGSGKSNVVDAILWVLGEQSTKTLRSEKMEDVIFNGTTLRKPLGMAEVSLTIGGVDRSSIRLDGGTGLAGQLTEFQELMITRRLYRNGESEYFINKTPCRLKDIRSLLLDTRAGSKGHTVIAQGQIDQILNASPRDRRELIEETAGIIRYKRQKAEALRKLDLTQQNLLRVRDVMTEIKKQLNSLERQARQARTYQAIQEEIRMLEVELLIREWRVLRKGLAETEEELATCDAKEASLVAEQGRVTAELEQLRLQAMATSETIENLRREVAELEQRQAQALMAAEVARNRGQLLEQQYQQETRELENLSGVQREWESARERIAASLTAAEQELIARDAACAELDREMAALFKQRAAVAIEKEQGQQALVQLTVRVANGEQALARAALRIEEATEHRLRLATERADLLAHLSELNRKRESISREQEETTVALRNLQKEHAWLHDQSAQAAAELQALDLTILRRSEELAGLDSRLSALQTLVREEMGYGRQGSDEATAVKSCRGVGDALAEWLVIPPALDRAVESFLGERVRGWLVDDPAAAMQALEFLREKSLGRGMFIPKHLRWGRSDGGTDRWWEELSGQPGVVGRAIDLIQTAPLADELLAVRDGLFERVVFVESLEQAVRLWERATWSGHDGPILVTTAGEILDASGMMIGGQGQEDRGLLERRREVVELERLRAATATELEQDKQRRSVLLRTVEELAVRAKEVGDRLRETELRQLSLRKDEEASSLMVADLSLKIGNLETDIARIDADRERYAREQQVREVELAQWKKEKTIHEERLAVVQEQLAELDGHARVLQEKLTQARLLAEGLRAKREHEQAEMTRVHLQLAEGERRRQALAVHIEELARAMSDSREEQVAQQTACRDLGESVTRLKAGLAEVQGRQAQEFSGRQALEDRAEEIRRAMTAVRDTRLGIEVRRAQLQVQLSTAENTLLETYQLEPRTLGIDRQQAGDSPVGASQEEGGRALTSTSDTSTSGSDDELRGRVKQLRERLDRMGPINLAAIREHEELDRRYTFLSAQEQDLSNSIASLKAIIQRINRTTKDLFAATFEELQQKFGEVFGQFFPGGRAELRLVEESPLEGESEQGDQEPGIDIVAQPPGKRLKNLAMLSGGEKTLTAMALLFASFLIRPTPFCLLDEIDAPLDEENIGRFTAVLRELARSAQFLVVTHNKRTMAIADSLFGVTMEEPGVSKLVSVRLADLQPIP